ncbi:beta-ketoacyl synthase domain-containing protein [Hypoxylon crocopeplum]|nr:beta-ketoacyl synthase domain-containing protein [Hypoxylon crocopeplum]
MTLSDEFSAITPSEGDFASSVLFCGNETPSGDFKSHFNALQRRARDGRFPLLSLFLENCTRVLKKEAIELPQSLQEQLPPFQNAAALADFYTNNSSGPLASALESALLCVLQVGMLIGYYEEHDLDYDLLHGASYLSGLSIGLLSAAAVSASSSLFDLAQSGSESVRVAFRLGIHVDRVSQNLESRDAEGNLDSWAYVVTGLSAADIQKELDIFHSATSNSEPGKVFISAADKNSVSVTGPPSRLKNAFLFSQLLRYSRHLPLPVYGGLCHAPHLYGEQDVTAIVSGSTPVYGHRRPVYLPVLSVQHGEPFLAQSVGGMLTAIVSEILTGTIFLDKLTGGIVDILSSSTSCRFVQFRTSIVSKSIVSAIESNLSQLKINHIDLAEWTTTTSLQYRAPMSPKASKLAVVGMSCRLPGGADNAELFWELMVNRRDVHSKIPADRFDLEAHYDPSGKTPNAVETQFGSFINEPGLFDASFFNMSPLEAEQTDPMHRLALVTAYEALEMAGYAPGRTPSTNPKRVGTFYGQASDDWRELNAAMPIGTYGVPGGERAFANGRINYLFKFGGPSFNIDTACSSGLAAVQSACSALWAGEADMVIAGGLNVITNPDNFCMLCKGHFLSKTGQCKVWEKDADGYCRADGIGSVVIKRLEDAEADNDNIIAVIAAGATNHSAEALSITQPHAGAQTDNYNQIIHASGINPLDVSYVELHGTGTQVGDAIESESVAAVFSPLSPTSPKRRPDQFLHLGAVKSNIGHGEAAAGIASLMKALLVFQKNQIPPHVPIKNMNPAVLRNIDQRNMGLLSEMVSWPRKTGSKRYALVNSFGAHGGNTTLLLEDAPERERVGQDPRSTHAFIVSAKSKKSLKGNITALLRLLDTEPVSLGDLSYTLCARRMHHPLRVATTASSVNQLRKFLESSLDQVDSLKNVPSETQVVMTFTGQGSFYEGISSQLYHDFPFYQSEVRRLDAVVQRLGFPSVLPFIEAGSVESTEASPLSTQLTILVVEIALARLWQFLGVTPGAVIGHSLGEYAALVVAGVLSASDAIYLVGKRAELLLSKCTVGSHSMLSVRASAETIAQHVGTRYKYEVSCVNGRENTVISGQGDALNAISAALKDNGVKAILLEVPFAFHSEQLDPVLPAFTEIASHVVYKTPQIPIISPLLKDCVFDGKTINAEYLARASREPVHFVGALDAAAEMGVADSNTLWIEMGPHAVCSTFVSGWKPEMNTYASLRRDENNFSTITTAMAALHCKGVPISWNEYFKPYEMSYRMLSLEAYQWNNKNYWITYEGTFTLDKAKGKGHTSCKQIAAPSPLVTSSIHQITSQEKDGSRAKVCALSDLKHPSLLPAVTGHKMNGYGVATTSIWADMALTLGEYIYKYLDPSKQNQELHMNASNMVVDHAQVISNDPGKEFLIKVEAELDLAAKKTDLKFYSLHGPSDPNEAFATCTISYEDSASWAREWHRVSHLVSGRIDAVSDNEMGNRVGRSLAYSLFANVVDYADKYRGMRSVTMVDEDREAVAEITLAPESHGNWHSAPHWIDSVCHIGGLVLNAGEDSRDFFYVTPGWGSYRMSKRLRGGDKYRSYVRMFPLEEKNMFSGDVYILQGSEIVGVMEEMKFRRVSRILMDRFFSPANGQAAHGGSHDVQKNKFVEYIPLPTTSSPPSAPVATPVQAAVVPVQAPAIHAPQEKVVEEAQPAADSTVTEALKLICRESGLEMDQLKEEALFAELGIDSLMSLVLAEKFRSELNLEVKSSLFLECANVKAFKDWLADYC